MRCEQVSIRPPLAAAVAAFFSYYKKPQTMTHMTQLRTGSNEDLAVFQLTDMKPQDMEASASARVARGAWGEDSKLVPRICFLLGGRTTYLVYN
jgi:hypothetical protein